MAKTVSRAAGNRNDRESGGGAVPSRAERRIEEFAEDLGRLLGTARAKAEGWIGQRRNVARRLEEIRDTAGELLKRLGGGWKSADRAVRADSPAATARPRKAAAPPDTPPAAPPQPRKKRTMSAAARQAISEAQKARWARQKRDARKAENE